MKLGLQPVIDSHQIYVRLHGTLTLANLRIHALKFATAWQLIL